MDGNSKTRSGLWWRLPVVVLVPFALEAVYCVLTRLPSLRFTATSDWIALGVATICGIVAYALLWRRSKFAPWLGALGLVWALCLPFLLWWSLLLGAVICGDSL